MKKYTIDYIKKQFADVDYEMLEEVYINAHTKMKYRCNNNHIQSMTYNNFTQLKRCPSCKKIPANKHDFDYVKQIFAQDGYLLLSTIYIDANDKLVTQCPSGHNWHTTFSNFKNRHSRCFDCSHIKPYTLEDAKEIFIKRNYILLSTSYKNVFTKLDILCPKGHAYKVSLHQFQSKQSNCPVCVGHIPYTVDTASKIFNKEGYIPLFTDYIDNVTPLKVQCPKGHIITPRLGDFLMGKRCKLCANNVILDIEMIKESIQKEGYEVGFSNYKNNNTPLSVICPNKHDWKVSWHNFSSGVRCPKCSLSGTSRLELKWLNFIQSLGFKAEKYKFTYNKKRCEIDIFIENKNIGIEIDGLIWHSERFVDSYTKRKEKLSAVNSLNCRLLTFFEDELMNKSDIIESILKNKLGISDKTIYARKTEIRELSKRDGIIFMQENHLQSSTLSEIYLGLYHENQLVAAISGGRHHRNNDITILVLNRLCFLKNHTIVGGSSKLLKYFIEYAKVKGYSTIVSWSDNRLSDGNIYKKLKFELKDELPLDYSYVKQLKRYSKQSMTKKKLLKMGAIGNTEREMAVSLGFYRIYDCGKKRWELKI